MKNYFTNLRQNELAIDTFFESAASIAGEMNVAPTFEETSRFRMRRRTARGSEGVDEPIEDPKTRFKIEFVFYLLDVIINSLDERFEQLTNISLNFKVLFNITDENITLDDCKIVETALTASENNEIEQDIDGRDLYNEIVAAFVHVDFKGGPKSIGYFELFGRKHVTGIISKLGYCVPYFDHVAGRSRICRK